MDVRKFKFKDGEFESVECELCGEEVEELRQRPMPAGWLFVCKECAGELW